MSETPSQIQTQNPLEQYKKLLLERLKQAENLKGIAEQLTNDLIKFIETLGFKTWGLHIKAEDQNMVTATFKAEAVDPSLSIDLLHVDYSISGKVSENITAKVYTIKDGSRTIDVIIRLEKSN